MTPRVHTRSYLDWRAFHENCGKLWKPHAVSAFESRDRPNECIAGVTVPQYLCRFRKVFSQGSIFWLLSQMPCPCFGCGVPLYPHRLWLCRTNRNSSNGIDSGAVNACPAPPPSRRNTVVFFSSILPQCESKSIASGSPPTISPCSLLPRTAAVPFKAQIGSKNSALQQSKLQSSSSKSCRFCLEHPTSCSLKMFGVPRQLSLSHCSASACIVI